MRDIVVRREPLRRLAHGLVDVALGANRPARLARRIFQRRAEGIRIVGRVRPLVPRDLQRLAALHRSPGVGRDHGDAAKRLEHDRRGRGIDGDDPDDTRHLHGIGGVEALHRAPKHRAPGDERVQHARQLMVHAVDGAAGRDREIVDDPDIAFADEGEVLGVLQLHLIARRNGQRCRGLGDVAVAERPAGPGVREHVLGRCHLVDGDPPMLRGGLDQHRLRGRAGMAHVHEPLPRRPRTVGILVAVGAFVGVGLNDPDLGPVGVEFVADDDAPASANALAHVLAVAGDRRGAVLGDGDEHRRVVLPAVRHAVGTEPFGERLLARAERQGEDQAAGAGEHPASAQVDDVRGVLGSAKRRRAGHHSAPLAGVPFVPGVPCAAA